MVLHHIAGALYTQQRIDDITALLPTALQNTPPLLLALPGNNPCTPVATPTAALPPTARVIHRQHGPDYHLVLLGNFSSIVDQATAHTWLTTHPVALLRLLAQEALAVVPYGNEFMLLHLDHQSILTHLRTPDQVLHLSTALTHSTGGRCVLQRRQEYLNCKLRWARHNGPTRSKLRVYMPPPELRLFDYYDTLDSDTECPDAIPAEAGTPGQHQQGAGRGPRRRRRRGGAQPEVSPNVVVLSWNATGLTRPWA